MMPLEAFLNSYFPSTFLHLMSASLAIRDNFLYDNQLASHLVSSKKNRETRRNTQIEHCMSHVYFFGSIELMSMHSGCWFAMLASTVVAQQSGSCRERERKRTVLSHPGSGTKRYRNHYLVPLRVCCRRGKNICRETIGGPVHGSWWA